MSKNNFIEKIQTIFNVTRVEIYFVLILISSSIIAIIFKFTILENYPQQKINNEKIQKILDSIAIVEQSTFIGTDINDDIDSTLAIADTLVKPEENQHFKRKEMPLSKIEINKANKEELMKLPGIGEKMAEEIIKYRKSNKFKQIDDLKKVKGIGNKKYEKIEPYIKIE